MITVLLKESGICNFFFKILEALLISHLEALVMLEALTLIYYITNANTVSGLCPVIKQLKCLSMSKASA